MLLEHYIMLLLLTAVFTGPYIEDYSQITTLFIDGPVTGL